MRALTHQNSNTAITLLHLWASRLQTREQQTMAAIYIGIQASFASGSAISSTFNPLFKVLFMFPSWSLFAIGFTLVSSLGWKLPPALRSIFKERDSWNASRVQRTTHLRQACHLPRNPFPKHPHVHLCWDSIWRKQFKVINLNFHTRLIPVHSPLLKKSHLVSDPPLTYMLKFSRSLCLIKLQNSSYPEGNFGGNQLLDGSISLSPLYSSMTNDLHVSIATSLHQRFPWPCFPQA